MVRVSAGSNIKLDLLLSPNPRSRNLSPTLMSQFSLMLQMAEFLYGERNREYSFLGMEFINGNSRVVSCPDTKEIAIQLGIFCLVDKYVAYGVLAHETIHYISPVPDKLPKRKILVIEEGLATFFSDVYMINVHNIVSTATARPPHYNRAHELVRRLLDLDVFAIKKLRKEQPVISYFTKELLLKYYPQLPEEIADELTQDFVYTETDLAYDVWDVDKLLGASGI